MKIQKLLSILLVLSLLAALLCGCGANTAFDAAGKEDAWLEDSTVAAAEDYNRLEGDTADKQSGLVSESAGSQAEMPANQKLIRTVNLNAETEDMDSLLAGVEERVAQLGGYIENRNVYNGKNARRESRWANLTIRIPADKLDQFVSQVSGISNVVSHNENTRDVTLSYVATESRITALETGETRLLELLAMAESLEDLLVLEEKLIEVRAQLEQYKSQLKVYDNQVNYATVNLSLEEVVKYTEVEEEEPEPTFWERVWDGFVNGVKNTWSICKGLVILTVSVIPYLFIPGCVVAIILVPRAIRRRKAKKTEGNSEKA